MCNGLKATIVEVIWYNRFNIMPSCQNWDPTLDHFGGPSGLINDTKNVIFFI